MHCNLKLTLVMQIPMEVYLFFLLWKKKNWLFHFWPCLPIHSGGLFAVCSFTSATRRRTTSHIVSLQKPELKFAVGKNIYVHLYTQKYRQTEIQLCSSIFWKTGKKKEKEKLKKIRKFWICYTAFVLHLPLCLSCFCTSDICKTVLLKHQKSIQTFTSWFSRINWGSHPKPSRTTKRQVFRIANLGPQRSEKTLPMSSWQKALNSDLCI